MKTKFLTLVLILPSLLMMSCQGSRSRRMIDAYGNAYNEYEETGDPTTLIVMIVAGIALGILWLVLKNKK